MSSVNGIHHVALVIPDLDQAISFYCNALEFELVKRARWDAPHPLFDGLVGLENSAADFCLLKSNNCYLEIFCYDSSKNEPTEAMSADHLGIRHFAFEITSVKDQIAKVIEAGGSLVGEHIQVKGAERPSIVETLLAISSS